MFQAPYQSEEALQCNRPQSKSTDQTFQLLIQKRRIAANKIRHFHLGISIRQIHPFKVLKQKRRGSLTLKTKIK
jgi:hypothetical protein